jgi:hypothetical protein
MTKKLSDLLEELAGHARKAGDATAAAEKEGREKIAARQKEAYAAAKDAIEKIDRKVRSSTDSASRDLSTVKAKIAADLIALKEGAAHVGHELDVKRAQARADRLEWEADFAIDYAIAAVEQAGAAALGAVLARVEAAKQAAR